MSLPGRWRRLPEPDGPSRIHSRPYSPGSFATIPEFIQMLVFPECIHGVKETVVAVRHELAGSRQALHGLAFEDGVVSAEEIEHPGVQHEKAGVDPGIGLGLFVEAVDAALIGQFD